MSTNLLPDDRRSLATRLTALQYMVAAGFAALAVGFWIFQVAQHDRFAEMAENNHLRRLPLPAPRGVLLDREGKVLVENRNIFNIALVREQTKNIDETLRALAAATGADEAQLRDTVARRRREPSYRPIVLIENASQEQVVAVWARQWELPGIIYQEVPSRRYRADSMAAHLFGYVGEITEAQLQRDDFEGVESGHHRRSGRHRAGLQPSVDGHRREQDGRREQRRPRDSGDSGSEAGSEGRPTAAADDRRGRAEGHRGRLHRIGAQRAAVVLDPRNGEVLGFSSRPAYDPNAFAAASTARPGRR